MDLIYYHGNCTDGWAAAYVAHLKYPEAKLVPAFYSTEPPYEDVEGKDVLMVDFSWKGRDVNIKLNLLSKSLHIFEHHKTAAETLKDLEFVVYDVNRSGAGLAWDYLFGKDKYFSGVDKLHTDESIYFPWLARPWWVDYVEDYDIWTKKLPAIEEVSAFLHSTPKTIGAWDDIDKIDLSEAEILGTGAWQQIRYQTDALVALANEGSAWGYTLGIVNGPFFTTTEVGHELAKVYDIGIVWSVRKDGKIAFGLRSVGGVDVSKIAQKFGGGGHKNSAGFEMDQQKGLALINSITHMWPYLQYGTEPRCV